MDLKPQDLVVLYKAAAHPGQRWTYAELAKALTMSPSEVHASVTRAVASGLAIARGRGDWIPVRSALIEFAEHGVRYVWPAVPGPVKRGVPTAFGTEPLLSEISSAPGEAPVWPHATGKAKGPALQPLYRTVPEAAMADPLLHRLLALQDGLRVGRARERSLSSKLLRKELGSVDAA
jgi:hypothetical protein